jgi:hypothetical protein
LSSGQYLPVLPVSESRSPRFRAVKQGRSGHRHQQSPSTARWPPHRCYDALCLLRRKLHVLREAFLTVQDHSKIFNGVFGLYFNSGYLEFDLSRPPVSQQQDRFGFLECEAQGRSVDPPGHSFIKATSSSPRSIDSTAMSLANATFGIPPAAPTPRPRRRCSTGWGPGLSLVKPHTSLVSSHHRPHKLPLLEVTINHCPEFGGGPDPL